MSEDPPPYDADLRTIVLDGVERTVTQKELHRLLDKGNVVHRAPDPTKTKTRDTFLDLLVRSYGFALEVPFRGLTGKRQWRFDAALPDRKIAVEYHGQGAHTAFVKGTWNDHEKLTEAQLCGWLVIQCNVKSVRDGRCLSWVGHALRETCPCEAQAGTATRR